MEAGRARAGSEGERERERLCVLASIKTEGKCREGLKWGLRTRPKEVLRCAGEYALFHGITDLNHGRWHETLRMYRNLHPATCFAHVFFNVE